MKGSKALHIGQWNLARIIPKTIYLHKGAPLLIALYQEERAIHLLQDELGIQMCMMRYTKSHSGFVQGEKKNNGKRWGKPRQCKTMKRSVADHNRFKLMPLRMSWTRWWKNNWTKAARSTLSTWLKTFSLSTLASWASSLIRLISCLFNKESVWFWSQLTSDLSLLMILLEIFSGFVLPSWTWNHLKITIKRDISCLMRSCIPCYPLWTKTLNDLSKL